MTQRWFNRATIGGLILKRKLGDKITIGDNFLEIVKLFPGEAAVLFVGIDGRGRVLKLFEGFSQELLDGAVKIELVEVCGRTARFAFKADGTIPIHCFEKPRGEKKDTESR